MPILDVTYHTLTGDQIPLFGGSSATPAPVRGPMYGSAQQLDFTSGQADGTKHLRAVTARVVTDADCRILVSDEDAPVATPANSLLLTAALAFDDITIPSGHMLSVVAV